MPKYRHEGEPTEACVCASASPAQAAALCTHLAGAKKIYVYQVHPDDVGKFKKVSVSWDSDAEYRAYCPVRLILTEEILTGADCVRPCTCGSGLPWDSCGYSEYCG